MRIGTLRRRVSLEKLVKAENEYNELVPTWVEEAKLWAEVEDLRGRDFHIARQVPAGEVTTRVGIRYRPGIDRKKNRIVDGSRILKIEAVLEPEGRRRKLELMCKELDSGRCSAS